MNKRQRIVIALSGGVDSSVAAFLLKKAGHDVIALFMRNWHDETLIKESQCPWVEDSHDALTVAEQLQIPFQIIDLSKEYKKRIVDYMIKEYQEGKTPNPDILCNREIKFDVFLQHALKLNADFIATGHYCQKQEKNGAYQLIQGLDKLKDQSYFLCQINQKQLQKIIFPIGELSKKEVRKIAQKNKLITADKKDSQGLCFVGKIKLPVFLQQKIKPKKGSIIEISEHSKLYTKELETGVEINYLEKDGVKLGEHNGAHYFTIGQRKGITIGGREKPLFVIGTDVKNNIVFVGMGESHPGLFRINLRIKAHNVHWVNEKHKILNNQKKELLVRIRHRQSLQKGLLHMTSEYLYIIFQNPQRGISKGQFAAWYQKDILMGSGPIDG